MKEKGMKKLLVYNRTVNSFSKKYSNTKEIDYNIPGV